MRKSGFTLIELLIVLAILGILVGIVAMSVGNLTATALERGLKSEYNVVQTAMDAFSTQDVAAGTETAIGAVTVFAPIAASTATGDFAKYLKRATKYYYTWAAGGDSLVVRNSDSATAYVQWNGTAITKLP